jgi:hypothetical protein
MATIIPFAVRSRATKSVSERPEHATIIIFPGVRYEKTRPGAEADDQGRPSAVERGSGKGRRKAR